MLAFVVEILLELVIPLGADLLVDGALHARSPRTQRAVNAALTAAIYFGLGLLVGCFSLIFFPNAIARNETLPGISLLITPTLAGLVMAAIGAIRARQGKLVMRLETFSYGFILALGTALIRFFFTQ